MSAPGIDRWGIKVLNELQTKVFQVGSVCEYIRGTFLAVSMKGIIHFSPEEVIAYYPTRLLSIAYLKEYNTVVGISANNQKFVVFYDNKLDMPTELDCPPCEDTSAMTMIYSSKSKTLITCGEHLIWWNVKYIPTPKTIAYVPSKIEVTQKNKVLLEEPTSFLNPPIFNKEKEILYVNSDNAKCINAYSINGIFLYPVIELKCDSRAVVAYCNKNSSFLTASLEHGVLLWHSSGRVLNRFSVSLTTPQAMRFFDSEHALILDGKGTIIVLDVKTGKLVYTYQTSDIVSRLYIVGDMIMMCIKSQIVILKYHFNWKYWTTTSSTPIKLERVNKLDEPGRIIAVCNDSYTRIHSPATRELLTSITLVSTANPLVTYYDRSSEYGTKRDHIFILLDNGTIPIYSTAFNPCEKVKTLDLRATGITFCIMDNEPYYAISCINGNILFYEYATMKQKKRAYIGAFALHGVFYSSKYNALLICMIDKVLRFDLESMKAKENVKIEFSRINIFINDDTLIYGYESGIFGIVQFSEETHEIHLLENSGIHYHDDEVTSFGAGYNYFISSSLDKSLRIWAYDFTILYRMEFPFPLYSCCVLNGTRKMLVGIDKEVMLVPSPFKGETDPPNPPYDNFDERIDSLSHEREEDIIEFDEDEEEKEESFLGSIGKNTPRQKTAQEILEDLRRQSLRNFENVPENPAQLKPDIKKKDIPDDEKASLIKEMALITESEEKREVLRQKSIEQFENQKKEIKEKTETEEYDYEYEEEVYEDDIKLEKQTIRKSKPKFDIPVEEKEEIVEENNPIDLSDTTDEDDEFIKSRLELKNSLKPNNYDYSAPLPKRIIEEQQNNPKKEEFNKRKSVRKHTSPSHSSTKKINQSQHKTKEIVESEVLKQTKTKSSTSNLSKQEKQEKRKLNLSKSKNRNQGTKQKEDINKEASDIDQQEENEEESEYEQQQINQNIEVIKENQKTIRENKRKEHSSSQTENTPLKTPNTKEVIPKLKPLIKEPEIVKSMPKNKSESEPKESNERGRSARTPRRKSRLPLLQTPPKESKTPSVLNVNRGTNPTFLDDNGTTMTQLSHEHKIKRFPSPNFRRPFSSRFPIYPSRKRPIRSVTPDRRVTYRDLPPNIVYDVNYIVKLVQEGNMQYLPILEALHFGPINLPPQTASTIVGQSISPNSPESDARPSSFASPTDVTSEQTTPKFTNIIAPLVTPPTPRSSPYSSSTDLSRLPPRFIQYRDYAKEKVRKPLLIIQSKFFAFPRSEPSSARAPRRLASQRSSRKSIDERNYASHLYEKKKKEGMVTIQESTATEFLPPLSFDLTLKKTQAKVVLPRTPQSARKPTAQEMCYFSIHRLMLGDADPKKKQVTDNLQQFKARYRTPLRDRRPRYMLNL